VAEPQHVLPKLFLRRSYDPIIMLGVLIVILGRDRIAGGLRISTTSMDMRPKLA
jgi:hypothetical protein